MYDQDDVMNLVEISFEKVSAYLQGVSQAGSGDCGSDLAYWLAGELARRGVVTSHPEYDGNGWAVHHATRGGAEFAIHCHRPQEKNALWRLSLRRIPNKSRSPSVPVFDDASILVSAIGEVIDDTGVGRMEEWRVF